MTTEVTLGDIAIHRVVEQEGSFFPAQEFFPTLTTDVLEANLHWLRPDCIDEEGRVILCVQSYLVRTPHHNILIDAADNVYISDFGLAKSLETSLAGLTRTGEFIGTPRYFSPEQVEGKPVDHRSDLYALGLVLYEMATGRLPFAGASPSETVTNVLERDPVPIARLAPRHPRSLDAVVRRLLAKRAGHRYPSAIELTSALLDVASPHPRLLARLRQRFLGS